MEKKKLIILIIIITFLVILTGGGYYYWIRRNYVSPISTVQVTPTVTVTELEELSTWEDQSQIKFQYPKSLSMNLHDEDTENYAHLEFTSLIHPGNLIVWVKDTNFSTIDAWVKSVGATNGIDTTLGGQKAKKVMISEPKKKILIGLLQNGYAYEIEADPIDFPYWNHVFDVVTESFSFSDMESVSPKNYTNSNENNLDSSGEIVEEEVIE